LTERVTALTRQIEEQGSLIRTTESQRNETSAELMTATAQVAKLTERENALTEKVTIQTQQLAEMQKQLTTEFENIANRIMKTSATELSDSCRRRSSTIKPYAN
jgi:DNA anti-recombination protein RmuC